MIKEEILINGKKITELSDMFFEYCKLKKENEELKTYIQKMDKPEIKTIDSEIALKNIELQKENDELKKQLEFSRTHKTVLDAERIKYKKALEEIRDMVSKLIAKKGYAEDEEDFILAKTQGVLNDK